MASDPDSGAHAQRTSTDVATAQSWAEALPLARLELYRGCAVTDSAVERNPVGRGFRGTLAACGYTENGWLQLTLRYPERYLSNGNREELDGRPKQLTLHYPPKDISVTETRNELIIEVAEANKGQLTGNRRRVRIGDF